MNPEETTDDEERAIARRAKLRVLVALRLLEGGWPAPLAFRLADELMAAATFPQEKESQ